jgi:hypothetical protein
MLNNFTEKLLQKKGIHSRFGGFLPDFFQQFFLTFGISDFIGPLQFSRITR